MEINRKERGGRKEELPMSPLLSGYHCKGPEGKAECAASTGGISPLYKRQVNFPKA